jgi:hypothetical protein
LALPLASPKRCLELSTSIASGICENLTLGRGVGIGPPRQPILVMTLQLDITF